MRLLKSRIDEPKTNILAVMPQTGEKDQQGNPPLGNRGRIRNFASRHGRKSVRLKPDLQIVHSKKKQTLHYSWRVVLKCPAITYFHACRHYHRLQELNGRVRNGNVCFLMHMVTGLLSSATLASLCSSDTKRHISLSQHPLVAGIMLMTSPVTAGHSVCAIRTVCKIPEPCKIPKQSGQVFVH